MLTPFPYLITRFALITNTEFECTKLVSRLNVVVSNYEVLVDSSYNNCGRKSSVDDMIVLSIPATPDAKQTYPDPCKFAYQLIIQQYLKVYHHQ